MPLVRRQFLRLAAGATSLPFFPKIASAAKAQASW
jgi:hypothetical protein